MSSPAGRLTWALLALMMAGPARAALAQPQVVVAGPSETGPLRHLTPAFTIWTTGFSASDPIVSLRFQVGAQAEFREPLVADTALDPAAPTIRLPRPLPQDTPLHWRATARTASGVLVSSVVTGPRVTRPWLSLVFPNEPNGTTVTSRQPELAWSSGTVDSPPGPWGYAVEISNAATRQVIVAQVVADTTFLPPAPLEANTPYRWKVTARLGSTDSTARESAATFVIVDTDVPLATLLYQSFPNPFPTASAQNACIWFDLHRPALVTLEIFDIRGRRVRRLLPARGVEATLRPGRYGREAGQSDSGCDPRFAWDGTGEDGQVAPAGVYLVRMRAGEQQLVKKILFRGR